MEKITELSVNCGGKDQVKVYLPFDTGQGQVLYESSLRHKACTAI